MGFSFYVSGIVNDAASFGTLPLGRMAASQDHVESS